MSTQAAPRSNWVPEWTFGDRIRKVRTELGLDQRELAEKLELKHSTLSSYESGRANPRATKLPAMAARLELISGVPRAWFLGWETENPHPVDPDGGNVPPNGIEPLTYSLQVDQLHEVTPIFGGRAA